MPEPGGGHSHQQRGGAGPLLLPLHQGPRQRLQGDGVGVVAGVPGAPTFSGGSGSGSPTPAPVKLVGLRLQAKRPPQSDPICLYKLL